MNYLINISYDGKNYYGWASQPNVPTVSKIIERAASEILGEKIKAHSSGRTDRYVHALSLPVLLRSKDRGITPEDLMNNMNKILPNDIKVLSSKVVEDNFQVRYDVKGKKYKYLTNVKGEGDSNYYNNLTWPFDFDLFKKTAQKFVGTKDFASFTGKEKYNDYIRTVNSINVWMDEDILVFEIVGVGFLRYMIRNIVGLVFAHNRGKVSDKELDDLFNNPIKGKAHYKAVGSGLYLVEVYY